MVKKKAQEFLAPFGNRTPGDNRYRCFLSDLAGLAAPPPPGSRKTPKEERRAEGPQVFSSILTRAALSMPQSGMDLPYVEKEFFAFVLQTGNVIYFAVILQELHSLFTLPGYKGIRERKDMETGFRLAAWSGRGGQMIRVVNLNKSFSGVKALENVSFRVRPGEMLAITGRHGAGKSVLLRQLCGLSSGDREEGYVMVGGASVQKNGLVSRDIRDIRAGMGIIFPDNAFAERVSVARNAVSGALLGPFRFGGTDGRLDDENVCRAMDALARMGLRDKAWQSTASLSCVQRWKLALARILVQGAQVLFAEDPALNTEPRSVYEIMELLSEFNAREGVTVVVALTDWTYARYCSRALVLDRGSIVYDGRVRSLPSGYVGFNDSEGFGGVAA